VTPRNRHALTKSHAELQRGHRPENSDCNIYQAIPEPFSVGWTLVSLARLDPAGANRARRWATARQAWASIGREDLIESVEAEFQ
jgi:hypothetical protein